MKATTMTNRVIVISGPSGVGKGTIVNEILSKHKNFALSVSATTRAPRVGENDGESYFFLTDAEFDALIANNQMLEYATVHGLNRYGTPREPVELALRAGKNVILEIDVQGALQVKKNLPSCVTFFIQPPSMDELAKRLAGRGTETSEEQETRLNTAIDEIAQASFFDFQVTNDDVSKCAEEVVKLSSR
jgi:guanylate kinase